MPQWDQYELWSLNGEKWELVMWFHEFDVAQAVMRTRRYRTRLIHAVYDGANRVREDILAELGKQKKSQVLVGFALETDNAIEYGKDKIKKKNLDLIIINTTSASNPAFGSDFNSVSLIDKHNNLVNFEFKSKQEIAKDIVEEIKKILQKNK